MGFKSEHASFSEIINDSINPEIRRCNRTIKKNLKANTENIDIHRLYKCQIDYLVFIEIMKIVQLNNCNN